MQTIYFVRHQVAGIITSHAFASPPTEAQMAPIIAECERLHGKISKKTGEPLWTGIHETVLLVDEVPQFPERVESSGEASALRIEIHGEGVVTNPPG